jgi:hypothetical protein
MCTVINIVWGNATNTGGKGGDNGFIFIVVGRPVGTNIGVSTMSWPLRKPFAA